MLEVIKGCVEGMLEAKALSQAVTGEVTQASPLTVKVEQHLVLSGPFLTMTERAASLALKAGDWVLMLRAQGGQDYYVLDRIERG